ncbi:MAG: UUP1 family membrane protein [Alphaproteobacteria bacterium]
MSRKLLYIFLLLSTLFAGSAIYYKINYWGFDLNPTKREDLWTIEAHISFEANKDENIEINLTTPKSGNQYKILQEDIIANGYKQQTKNNTLTLTSSPLEGVQDIYYKAMLFDNSSNKGKEFQKAPKKAKKTILEEQKAIIANKIIEIAKKEKGNSAEQLIRLINKKPANATVLTFLPQKKSPLSTAEALISLLNWQEIPARIIRGIKLEENKKSLSPDLMLEVYIKGAWRVYDIETAKAGIPQNFVTFQKGNKGLLNIMGGSNSTVKFSTIKSLGSSFILAEKRADISKTQEIFKYSIYSLPLTTQNTLKWLSIFPLAILIVVLMRNVIGLQTMGTFTPMLISLALVKTGFLYGISMFAIMIVCGLLLRALLSKFHLLLVPRISAVVIFVILFMQLLAVLGYNFELKTAHNAVYFPIIIMSWIIERASITWEEDGAKNALTEILYSLLSAIITYFIVVNENVRHIMFAFNEINIVILALVMLLGTYTGYRLTELFRFKSLGK